MSQIDSRPNTLGHRTSDQEANTARRAVSDDR
jgi:hypothetical protein